MGGILDHAEAVAPRQLGDASHVAALPGEGHGNHYLGQGAVALGALQAGVELGDVEVEGRRVDVDEIHLGAAIKAAIGAGDEGVGAGPEAVARPQVEGQAGNVQGGGGVAHGDAMGGLATLGNGLLEAFDGRALGQPVGTQGVDHRIDVGLADVLATVGNHGQAQASASCRSSGTLR